MSSGLRIIKQDKDMQKMVLENFDNKDINILAFMMNNMKNAYRGEMVIEFKQFKILFSDYEESKLTEVGEKIAKMGVFYTSDSVSGFFHVFTHFEINQEKKVFALKINELFLKQYKEIIGWQMQYFMDCIALERTELKKLYWILNQARNEGKCYISLERLKEVFGISSSNVLTNRIIKQVVQQMMEYFPELRYEKITSGSQYKRIKGYNFIFKIEKQLSAYDYETMLALEMQTNEIKKLVVKPYILTVEDS